jgi:hypothetical protein
MRIALIFGGLMTNPKDNNNRCYIEPCYLHYKKHLFNCNKSHDIDIYIHLWSNNVDSKKEQDKIKLINDLYKPTKIIVQTNEESNNFVSKFKSNQNGFNLISDQSYDLCFFSRLDIIINRDINFEKYDKQEIYHNDGMPTQGGHFGDFYFILNFENSKHFSNLYDKIQNKSNEQWTEQKWRDEYIPILESHLLEVGKINNDLRAGSYKEVEVYRKFRF